MKKRSIKWIKCVGFLVVFLLLFNFITETTMGYSGNDFLESAGFFEEPPCSLDAVYIGASTAFSGWSAPLAWGKYNIAMRVFSNNTLPLEAEKYFLELAMEQQPEAVYLISINGVYEDLPVENLHSTVDYFKCSSQKYRLIPFLSRIFQLKPSEQLELVCPLIRYHSKWNRLGANSFHKDFGGYKGGATYSLFFQEQDISYRKPIMDGYEPLPGHTQEALTELLDYCENNDVKAVFVLSAQYRYDDRDFRWFNTMSREIKSRGFPLINMCADFAAIGLDDTMDFYDVNHTNIHGAMKITDYLSQYLLAHYDFPEKAGGYYKSWDEAYVNYKAIITPYLTEEELAQLP